jgi:hypothetical protein
MRSFYSLGLHPLVRTALAAALGLCLACSSQSPKEKLLDTAQKSSSWIATLRMAGEQWGANSVPTSFVETTVKAARDEFKQEAEDAKKSKAPPEIREPFRQIVTEAKDVGKRLSQAAEANDRPGAAREVAQLAALQGRLEELQKQNGGGSQ